jgi:hypothetical protein
MLISHINEYIFAKHNILPRTQVKSIVEVARNHFGLHSARIMTPYITLCSRLNEFNPRMLMNQLYGEKKLIKLRCVRTTLHITPHDLASILHVATKKIRIAECKLFFRKNNISDETINAIWENIKDELIDVNKAEYIEGLISVRLNSSIHEKRICSKMLLKYFWENGYLCYVNISDDWEKENRRYAVVEKYYNGLNLESCDTIDAQKKLVYNYIKYFGPVTARDFAWWSGLSVGIFNEYIHQNMNIVTKIICDDSDLVFYVLSEELKSIQKYQLIKEDWVALLAYEDPSLKGYKESRSRYIDSIYYDRLFNQIGEVRASIIHNGKAIGIWSWGKKNKKVELEYFEKPNDYILKSVFSIKDNYENILDPYHQKTMFEMN